MDKMHIIMTKRNLVLTIVFFFIAAFELISIIIDSQKMEYVAKPLIMVWITVYFLFNRRKSSLLWLIIIAFLFSWTGDVLLMFSSSLGKEILFYAGVGGFFLSQISYISVFLMNKENDIKGFILRNPLWLIPLIGYGSLIYLFLLPELEGIMQGIILIYAVALVGMSLAALNRRDRVGKSSFQYVFIGSLFFVTSDSILAVNKFHTDIPASGILIMSTYILAQYLIMRGLILEKPKNKEA